MSSASSRSGWTHVSRGLPLVVFIVVGHLGLTTMVQGKYDVMDARSGKKTSEEDVSARTDETRPPSPGSFDIDAEHKRLTERFEAELERYTIKPVPRPAQENGGDGHGR